MADTLEFERHRAYRTLVEMILRGDLDPNEPLSERKLSTALGIGRTPVREALRDLARDGVVVVQPARGTYLRQITVDDFREINEVRQCLECTACSLAAKRGVSPELLQLGTRLRKAIEGIDRSDVAIIYETGIDFHIEVFRCTQNHQLIDIYERLRLRFPMSLNLLRDYDEKRVQASIKEHYEIFETIRSGDAGNASRLMSEHLTRGFESRIDVFASLVSAKDKRTRTV